MLAPLLGVAFALVVLGAVFTLLERARRTRPGPPWFRRQDAPTDLAWFLTAPFVTRAVTAAALVVTAVVVLLVSGRSLASARAELAAGGFPDFGLFGLGAVVRAWPLGVQFLAGFFVGDLFGYAQHRLFHRRPLWPFHAVHHSSPRLDWLSSVRVHPVNEFVARVLQAVPVLLLGFDPRVVGAYAPFMTLYAILLHADVRWDYGPLRHVIASPLFHRWHHAADREAIDTNFAGFFPVIDLVFGTYRLPRGELPRVLGAPSTPVPGRFLAQLAYPFRRARPGERLAADAGAALRAAHEADASARSPAA